MIIDIIFFILLVLALFKGLRKGFVLAVFSFAAVIIGLAAAMKLSALVAGWLQNSTHISAKWLPVISFAIVMIAVVLLVRWCAALIQAGMDMALLGWLNKLAGVCLYAALYITVFSVVLFFAREMHLLKPETIEQSSCYHFIEPWGPYAINGIGKLVPVFKNLFEQLQQFFASVAEKAAK